MIAAKRAGPARWLAFAASPTFAAMAVVTAVGTTPAMAFCSGGSGFALGGMVPMYLLMILFHAAPWFRLFSGESAPV